MIAIDVSASMLAKDLKPNRLQALKNVAEEFIKNRPSDRIGLVEYAGESYTKTPLTLDKNIILRSLSEIKYNNIIEGGFKRTHPDLDRTMGYINNVDSARKIIEKLYKSDSASKEPKKDL